MKKFSKPFADLAIAWKSNDFLKARFKLTFFYFLILAGILVSFSVALQWQVEKNITEQIQNISLSPEKAENIILQKFPNQIIIKSGLENENGKILFNVLFEDGKEINLDPVKGEIIENEEDFQNFEDELSSNIGDIIWILDIFILFFASFLSYFLAGKTLQPIEKKMKEQKQFIADAAHELKNPLSAISASSESILRAKKISETESREVFGEILEESQRLMRLTSQLLELENKEENIKQKIANSKKTIKKVIKKILPLAKKKNISLVENLEDMLLPIREKDLETIVFNLLHNAIKFSPKNSEVIISLGTTGKLSVQDFGIGIDKKDIPFIFDRFYKADTSRTFTKESGSGLGLSIVKKIVDENNGNIEVQCEVEKGCTFFIVFTSYA